MNEDVYCIEAKFGENETTMNDCRQNLIPDVVTGRCVEPGDPVDIFGGIDLTNLFAGIVPETTNGSSLGNKIADIGNGFNFPTPSTGEQGSGQA